MGVPKFYRWISERYPCLSEVVREHQIPEFDNLYLDMNGIIHNCSHPNDDDVHFRISEEQVFQDIFRYIEFLFRMIKPRKVFFMAVDGVAPRAKMNQQRGRRFRSAKEAEKKEDEARKRGEELPKEKRFDSNCITPGTEFMDRLQQALKWFVAQKMSSDELWQPVTVILSGHETPGEGEHKIMDYIRYQKSQSSYDPNTRHCLYGLDADLIVLGLCSHEPHFSLLREEVKFLKPKADKKTATRTVNPDVITFHLLHLSLLRDYLDLEFSELKETLPFDYSLEKVIDDWILMGFLVGNDFIPHIPHFHINKNSLTILYQVYIHVLPSLDGYLNEDGVLNLKRFEVFLSSVAQVDEENFSDIQTDLKYLEGKSRAKLKARNLVSYYEEGENEIVAEAIKTSSRFAPLDADNGENVKSDPASDAELSDGYEEEDEKTSPDDDSDEDNFRQEFKRHKQKYYENKLDYEKVDAEVLKDQAYGYIRALQWNLHYYYNGCVSWSWYYPHHYAPYISDVKNFSNVDLKFDSGKPFKPFEQLLAVLPAASKDLLPKAYQRLVTDTNSPLIKNYPQEFELDMNEKQQDWEAVVKIPFIDEQELLKAADECSLLFSAQDKARNIHGPHIKFTYSPDPQPAFSSPYPFLSNILSNHAVIEEIEKDRYRISSHVVRKGLCPGVRLDVHFPGFPTLKFIEHSARLKAEKVRVFEMCSNGDNMILEIMSQDPGDMLQLAMRTLGKAVFVNWPHLMEAKVMKVTDFNKIYLMKEKGKGVIAIHAESLEQDDSKEITSQLTTVSRLYKERKGIILGRTYAMLIVQPITGRKYIPSSNGTLTLEKQYSVTPMYAPLQTVVMDIAVHDSEFQRFKTVEEMYPVGTRCFVLAPQYYGQPAVVLEPPAKDALIRVKITVSQEPDMTEVKEREHEVLQDEYQTNYVMAQKLGISGHVLSRFLGCIFIKRGNGKANLGLNLRFNSRQEEVPGFSKKVDDVWLFSNQVLGIMEEFLQKFPEVIQNLSANVNKDVFDVEDIFPADTGEAKLPELLSWLKSLPCYHASRQKVGTQILDSCVVKFIEKLLNTHDAMVEESKEVILSLKPNLVYRPLPHMGYSLPDPSRSKFELYDRVVNVREGTSVPLGLKGVVIGKHVDEERELNTLYDVLFDEEFPGGVALRCSSGRGYKMPAASLLNLDCCRTSRPKQKLPDILQTALQPNRQNGPRPSNRRPEFLSEPQQQPRQKVVLQHNSNTLNSNRPQNGIREANHHPKSPVKNGQEYNFATPPVPQQNNLRQPYVPSVPLGLKRTPKKDQNVVGNGNPHPLTPRPNVPLSVGSNQFVPSQVVRKTVANHASGQKASGSKGASSSTSSNTPKNPKSPKSSPKNSQTPNYRVLKKLPNASQASSGPAVDLNKMLAEGREKKMMGMNHESPAADNKKTKGRMAIKF